MSLVLRSFQRSAEFIRTWWSIRPALNILPLIDQNEPWCDPWCDVLRSKVHVFDTFPGTPVRGASGRSLPGTRACCDDAPRTRNCISAALREPVPASSLRGIVLSRMSWPDFPRKSTTTSARCAGPSSRSCRVTGAGSRPLPVPTWVNAEPSESAKS